MLAAPQYLSSPGPECVVHQPHSLFSDRRGGKISRTVFKPLRGRMALCPLLPTSTKPVSHASVCGFHYQPHLLEIRLGPPAERSLRIAFVPLRSKAPALPSISGSRAVIASACGEPPRLSEDPKAPPGDVTFGYIDNKDMRSADHHTRPKPSPENRACRQCEPIPENAHRLND